MQNHDLPYATISTGDGYVLLDELSMFDIRSAMTGHRNSCRYAFHRDCLEYIILGQYYLLHHGNIESWNPQQKRSRDEIRFEFHCLHRKSLPPKNIFED